MLVSKQIWHGLTDNGTCHRVVAVGLVLYHMPFNRSLLQLSDVTDR